MQAGDEISRSRSGRRSGWAWGLVALLGGGLALRVAALSFGLPLVDARPDERHLIIRAITLALGDLDPHYFHYPSAYFYVLGAILTAQGGVATLLGGATSVQSWLAGFFLDPTRGVLTARLVAGAASTATIWAVYDLGRRLVSRRAGQLAAAATAGTFLLVRDAHFGVIDSPLTLLVVLAATAAVRASRSRSGGAALAAGALAGLATGFKYNAALLGLPLVLACLFRDGETGRARWRAAPGLLAAAGGAMALAFAATTPGAILDWPTFQRDVAAEVHHLATGHASLAAHGWWLHLAVNLRYGLGLPLLAAAGLGLVLRLARPSAADLIVFSFPLVYYLAMGRGQTSFARYMLPVIPFACVAAAAAVDRLVSARFRDRRRGLVAGGLVLGVVLAPSLVRAVRFDVLLGRPDTRAVLAQWWLQHVPPGTPVAWLGEPWSIPLVYDVIDEPSLQGWLPPARGWRREVARLRRAAPRPVYPVRWLGRRPAALRWRLAHLAPALVVVETGPLFGYTVPAAAVPGLLPGDRYERVFTVDPARPGAPPGVYDQQDAFFVPLAGLGSVRQPGPALAVYRRRG